MRIYKMAGLGDLTKEQWQQQQATVKEQNKVWREFYEQTIEPKAVALHRSFDMPLPNEGDAPLSMMGDIRRSFHINKIGSRLLRDWNIWFYSTPIATAQAAYSLWCDAIADFVAGLEDVQARDARSGRMTPATTPLKKEFPGGTPSGSPWGDLMKAFDIHYGLLKTDYENAFEGETYSKASSYGMLQDYRNMAEIAYQEKMMPPDENLIKYLDKNTQLTSPYQTYQERNQANAMAIAQMAEESNVEKLKGGGMLLTPPEKNEEDDFPVT